MIPMTIIWMMIHCMLVTLNVDTCGNQQHLISPNAEVYGSIVLKFVLINEIQH